MDHVLQSPRVDTYLRRHAREMAFKTGGRLDVGDAEQALRLQVIRKLPHYNPIQFKSEQDYAVLVIYWHSKKLIAKAFTTSWKEVDMGDAHDNECARRYANDVLRVEARMSLDEIGRRLSSVPGRDGREARLAFQHMRSGMNQCQTAKAMGITRVRVGRLLRRFVRPVVEW